MKCLLPMRNYREGRYRTMVTLMNLRREAGEVVLFAVLQMMMVAKPMTKKGEGVLQLLIHMRSTLLVDRL